MTKLAVISAVLAWSP